MKEIIKLLRSFSNREYECNRLKWDYDVTKKEYELAEERIYEYFHSLMTQTYGRAGAIDDSDQESIDFSKIKILRQRQRILFQVRSFRDFELGEYLKKVVTGNIIYRADMSYYQETPIEFSSISDGYYLAETDEGLKIIYGKSFDWEKGKWRHSHDGDWLHVKKEGTQLEVERIEAPLDPISLKEYNKD